MISLCCHIKPVISSANVQALSSLTSSYNTVGTNTVSTTTVSVGAYRRVRCVLNASSFGLDFRNSQDTSNPIPANNDSGTGRNSHISAIIGSCVAAVVGLLLIGGFYLFYRVRRNRQGQVPNARGLQTSSSDSDTLPNSAGLSSNTASCECSLILWPFCVLTT